MDRKSFMEHSLGQSGLSIYCFTFCNNMYISYIKMYLYILQGSKVMQMGEYVV